MPLVHSILSFMEQRVKILVVEDEPEVRVLVSAVLKQRGYEVLAASDGKEALKISREHKGEIHVLLSDVEMPNLDGIGLSEIVAEERPATKVILMSGGLPAERTGKVNPAMFVRKPFLIDDLLKKIARVLSAKLS